MTNLKEFLKNHALWIGLVAVVIPLVAHLGLQYRSLSELEATMPWARRALMRKYLQELTREVASKYRSQAETVLNIPSSGFADGHLPEIADHFSRQHFNGARRLFIGATGMYNDRAYAAIMFYNPETSRLERDPDSPAWRAAHAGAANWMAMIMTRSGPIYPRLTVDDRDPNNRVIVKPILDSSSQVVGVAGMILDEKVFREEVLPEAIKATLQKAYPSEADKVIITVTDAKENLIFANQPAEGRVAEAAGTFPFVFTDWYLGIRMRDLTENQLARRYFLINFSLSIIASLILLGGILLALRAASRAMKLSKMKADFVSNVSHELRTPLASIRVFGELLKLGRVKDELRIQEYGTYIETESRRLTQLINNILDFSRIESGQKSYRFEPADVADLIAETLKLFVVRLEQNGFKIVFQTSPKPLPGALIDTDAIAQAFINLLDNAVKYSGEGRLITVRVEADGDFVRVSVADTGTGIESQELEKIFEKFYRVSTGLVHDVKGSGLGLSIVKHIVEAHRGQVLVRSTVGEGSVFTILLPKAQADENQEPESRSRNSAILPDEERVRARA